MTCNHVQYFIAGKFPSLVFLFPTFLHSLITLPDPTFPTRQDGNSPSSEQSVSRHLTQKRQHQYNRQGHNPFASLSRNMKAKPRECIKYLTSKNLDHLTTIITVLHQLSFFSIEYTSLISTINILSQLAYFSLPHTHKNIIQSFQFFNVFIGIINYTKFIFYYM